MFDPEVDLLQLIIFNDLHGQTLTPEVAERLFVLWICQYYKESDI